MDTFDIALDVHWHRLQLYICHMLYSNPFNSFLNWQFIVSTAFGLRRITFELLPKIWR